MKKFAILIVLAFASTVQAQSLPSNQQDAVALFLEQRIKPLEDDVKQIKANYATKDDLLAFKNEIMNAIKPAATAPVTTTQASCGSVPVAPAACGAAGEPAPTMQAPRMFQRMQQRKQARRGAAGGC